MVMGLGLNDGGFGAVKYAISQRVSELIITDSKSADVLKPTLDKINLIPNKIVPIRYVFGEQNKQDYANVDIIIKNPGVPRDSPYLEIARQSGVEITTDIELFFNHINSLSEKPKVIGVTGTRGKSTTTSLIYHILSNFYGESKVHLGGNIRRSILNLLSDIDKDSYIVLELSSFQLDNLVHSPHIGVFTSFFPDHLDRYDSLDEYFISKTNIVNSQSENDFAVLNIDNDRIKTLSHNLKSSIITYSLNDSSADLYIEQDYIIKYGQKFMLKADIPLYGEHNQYNVMAAISVTTVLGVPDTNIISSIKSFIGISGRQQSLGYIDGIEIINDTTSTMPVALAVALDTFKDKPYVVICGGEDKGLDYSDLKLHIHPSLKSIVLLPGSGSQLIKKYMNSVDIYEVMTLEEAVECAFDLALPNERIIFSPGATSFGMFLNEFDRGDKFISLIQAKKNKHAVKV
jgi:UDP-N-acetylmuramoylalanine--D-glutamate ligase